MKKAVFKFEESLDVLLQSEHDGADNKLFGKSRNICLKIALFKTPKIIGIQKKYLKLRHSRFGDDPEICLFVPNRRSELNYKISVDESIDHTINYYTDFFEKHKVKGIQTVMPVKQLQSEYSTFELRRKLVDRFDLFLCKNSLLYNTRFLGSLGKYFIKKKKEPLGVSFPAADALYDPTFNNNIKRAIFSTVMCLKSFSDNYSIVVGTTIQSKKVLRENIKTILEQIFEENVIPGGINNIRALYLSTSVSKCIPFYISTDFPKDLPTPKVKGKRKKMKSVEGEITTLPGKRVIVKPGGTVLFKKPKSKEVVEANISDDDDEEFDDGSEENFTDENDKFALNTENINDHKKNEEEESESESDEEIERRERKLLKQSLELQTSLEEDDQDDDDDDDEDEEKLNVTPKKVIKMGKKNSIKKTNLSVKNNKKEKKKVKSRKRESNKSLINEKNSKKLKGIGSTTNNLKLKRAKKNS